MVSFVCTCGGAQTLVYLVCCCMCSFFLGVVCCCAAAQLISRFRGLGWGGYKPISLKYRSISNFHYEPSRFSHKGFLPYSLLITSVMDSPIKKRRVDELANTTTATTTTAAHAAPVPPLLDLNQAVLDPFDQPDFGVPRYYRIPELAPEGERVYANNPPPPPHPTDEQSPVVDTLEYKGDIYLCQWMLDWIPLQDLWSFHQTTRQRTMDFRLLIKGKEDDSSMPAGLAALYKRKLIQVCNYECMYRLLFSLMFWRA